MLLDVAMTLGGLVIPPAFDFIKKMFLKPSQDTPEATISSLATTSPDILPAYINAVVEHLKAKTTWFNRDVIGTPSQWVVDLRSAIRPIVVVAGLVAMVSPYLTLDPGVRLFFEGAVGSWMGSRLVVDE